MEVGICVAGGVEELEQVDLTMLREIGLSSIYLGCYENEMRWNTKGEDAAAENAMIQMELPKLRTLLNELDPTRIAYHDGDSSLWNEATQPIISRHYGKECAGIGWWGKNTMVLANRFGPWILLGSIVTSAPLDVTAPDERTCGTCSSGTSSSSRSPRASST